MDDILSLGVAAEHAPNLTIDLFGVASVKCLRSHPFDGSCFRALRMRKMTGVVTMASVTTDASNHQLGERTAR